MKILYLCDLFPPHDFGGAEKVAYAEVIGMAKLGHKPIVFTSDSDIRGDTSVEELHRLRITVYRPFSFRVTKTRYSADKREAISQELLTFYNPWISSSLYKVLIRENPDIVHAHYIPRISYGALRSVVRHNVPLVQTFHNYHFECPKTGLYRKRKESVCVNKPFVCRLRNIVLKALMPVPERIIAISKFAKERLEKFSFPSEKIFYLPNGVTVRKDYSESEANPKEIIFIGRTTKAKGVDILIKAFLKIYEESEYILRIIGDGHDIDYFKSIARGNDRIIFSGRLQHEQAQHYLKLASVVVVPSVWFEIFGLVVAEPMAWGKVVIASNLGGIPDLIQHGINGFLFEPGNVDSLKDCLRTLMRNDELRKKMGKAAFASVRFFSQEAHIQKLETLYRDVLRKNDFTC